MGTLKFLCEIFSITPYLSLAVGRPFHWLPLPRLSCSSPLLPLLPCSCAPLLTCTPLTSFFCSCRSCSCVKSLALSGCVRDTNIGIDVSHASTHTFANSQTSTVAVYFRCLERLSFCFYSSPIHACFLFQCTPYSYFISFHFL